jgi:hypothetical protein
VTGKEIRLGALVVLVLLGQAHAQSFDRDDPRARLFRALGLVEAQRASLQSTALPLASRGGKYAGLKACIEGKATDARLGAELASALQASLPRRESAEPVLRFIETGPGRKYVAAIAQRNRVAFQPAATPGRHSVIVAGVVMYSNEVSEPELLQIQSFVGSDDGKALRGILAATGGFGQLTQTIAQMNRVAAECGIDVK